MCIVLICLYLICLLLFDTTQCTCVMIILMFHYKSNIFQVAKLCTSPHYTHRPGVNLVSVYTRETSYIYMVPNKLESDY